MRSFIALCALSVAAATFAQGPGPVAGKGKGPGWSFGPDNTPGWGLMSAEERIEHRNKMMSLQTYDECRIYVEGHHRVMAARAKEKGRTLPDAPRNPMCERMKQAGRLK